MSTHFLLSTQHGYLQMTRKTKVYVNMKKLLQSAIAFDKTQMRFLACLRLGLKPDYRDEAFNPSSMLSSGHQWCRLNAADGGAGLRGRYTLLQVTLIRLIMTALITD